MHLLFKASSYFLSPYAVQKEPSFSACNARRIVLLVQPITYLGVPPIKLVYSNKSYLPSTVAPKKLGSEM